MTPEVGKFYYIDYTDHDQPEGSFFGVARCIQVHDKDETGKPVVPPLYEFEHHDKEGKMWRSLFYANEVVMSAQ